MGEKLDTKEERTVSRVIHVTDIIEKRNFNTFHALAKEVAKQINHIREDWLKYTLKKNNVDLDEFNTERERQEAFEKNNISIIRERSKDKDVDIVYLNGVIIGEWNNSKKIRVNKNGKLVIKIKYFVL